MFALVHQRDARTIILIDGVLDGFAHQPSMPSMDTGFTPMPLVRGSEDATAAELVLQEVDQLERLLAAGLALDAGTRCLEFSRKMTMSV